MARKASRSWVRYALIGLIVEKIVQHLAVSLAFYFNWSAIGATVAVSPRLLLLLGIVVAAAFALSLWGLLTDRKWAVDLVIALAWFDLIGEFVVQGTIRITITVSFLAAIALLILALLYRRWTANPTGGSKG